MSLPACQASSIQGDKQKYDCRRERHPDLHKHGESELEKGGKNGMGGTCFQLTNGPSEAWNSSSQKRCNAILHVAMLTPTPTREERAARTDKMVKKGNG